MLSFLRCLSANVLDANRSNTLVASDSMASFRVKLVIVGDGGCGKTSLLSTFNRNQFPETYVPTEFDISTAQMKLDGNQVELTIRDTSGQEDYDRLRPLSYPNSNAVLVCFAVDAPDSLENVAEKWSPEIQYYCRDIPVILVGNKMDLRDDPNTIHKLSKKQQEPVTFGDGVWVAQKIGAQVYQECSAKSGERVQNVFETAAKAGLQLQSPKAVNFI